MFCSLFSAFAGTCVGYHNHRYYLAACVHAWLGATLGLYWHWNLIWGELGGLRLGTAWYCIMPHLALMTFQIGLWQFVIAGIQMSSMVCVGLSSFLFSVQIIKISQGQTQQEAWLKVKGNHQGLVANFKEVLGAHWLLACLVWFFPSPLPGNGLRFPRKTEDENIKDM